MLIEADFRETNCGSVAKRLRGVERLSFGLFLEICAAAESGARRRWRPDFGFHGGAQEQLKVSGF